MPLITGKSAAAFSANVRAEEHSGTPQKQAVAIAYSEKRKAMRKGKTSRENSKKERRMDADD